MSPFDKMGLRLTKVKKKEKEKKHCHVIQHTEFQDTGGSKKTRERTRHSSNQLLPRVFNLSFSFFFPHSQRWYAVSCEISMLDLL